MKRILIILAPFLVLCTLWAHSDSWIKIEADGSLEGLPAAYNPGQLIVRFSKKADRKQISSVRLRIGEKETDLPACITDLLRTQRPSEIRASASWYHEETLLPHYIKIQFFNPGFDEERWANSGYSLLFNLHDAKLLQMEEDVAGAEGNSLHYETIDLRAKCTPAEFAAFTSPAAATLLESSHPDD